MTSSSNRDFYLRLIEGSSFKGIRVTYNLKEFMKKMQLKTPGLILPSFYLLQSNPPDPQTGASQHQLPQNEIAKYPGDHLRFVGLFDVDMPTGSAKLDPSKVNSLATARATNKEFDQQ